MADTISNNDDVIDSRDVIARIEYLRDEARAEFERENPDAADCVLVDEDYGSDGPAAWLAPEDGDELRSLERFASEGEDYASDWTYGATLIRDSYFRDYAQEMAEDIGAVDPNASWPLTCIDWEQAARELRMDYTAVEFDGVTYWVR